MENPNENPENQMQEMYQEEVENPEEIGKPEQKNQTENISNEKIPTPEMNQGDIDIEVKKENFRKYLEDKGMMDILTKLLVELYERNDRPIGPDESFEYCSRFFSKLEGYDINTVNSEIEHNKEKLNDLQSKLDELKKELDDPEQQ